MPGLFLWHGAPSLVCQYLGRISDPNIMDKIRPLIPKRTDEHFLMALGALVMVDKNGGVWAEWREKPSQTHRQFTTSSRIGIRWLLKQLIDDFRIWRALRRKF